MAKRLLNVTEACIHLGITKELLYAYIKKAPKSALKHDRKLISEDVDGENMFDENELNSFDAYLKEPWSEEGEKRPNIPSYIKQYLETEIGGQCPITKKGNPLENAHIVDYNVSRSHHHHNVIRIAKDVHTKYDTGVLPKENLKKVKQRLIENLKQRLKIETGAYKATVNSPKPHSLFIGRDSELIELIEYMGSERLVVIEGIGGVGKTQLLLNAIDNVQYHCPLIWIDTETIGSLNDLIILITNEISKIEGVNVTGSLIDALSSARLTLVLDSLENLLIPYRDEVEDFIQLLMTSSENVQLLITSQIDLSVFDTEKTIIKLDGISDSASTDILYSLLNDKIEVDDEQLKWVLWFCGGHPLSLKLTGVLINFYRSTAKAIQHLEKADSLKQPLRTKHNKRNALFICLNTVYSILSKGQRKVLQDVKFYPVGIKRSWVESKLELDDFDIELASLQQFFLVEITTDVLGFERISTKNPFRKFLYDRSVENSKEEHLAFEKETLLGISFEAMLVNHKYIETSTYGSAEYGILRMESELPNIMEAFHRCKDQVDQNEFKLSEEIQQDYELIIGNIASALGKYFFVRGFYTQGVLMAKEGIRISLKREMYESAAVQHIYLSQLQSRQYDFNGVEQTIREMEKLADLTNENYVIIANQWMKGRYLGNKGENKLALKHLGEVANLMEARMNRHKVELKNQKDHEDIETSKLNEVGNLGLVYSEIGGVYENENHFEKALEYNEKALKILLELNDEVNILGTYYALANCYVELGQLEKAIEYYFCCVEGYLQQGNNEYLANTLAELGRNIEFDPKIVENKLLTASVFRSVFNNVNYRIKNITGIKMHKSDDELFSVESLPFDLIGQMVLLVKLLAFSEHRKLLYDWSVLTKEELGVDLNEINPFCAILKLAHVFGIFDHWKDLPKKEQKQYTESICISCLILNGGPNVNSKTRIFQWLAKLFQYLKIDEEAKAEKLFDEITNHLDSKHGEK